MPFHISAILPEMHSRLAFPVSVEYMLAQGRHTVISEYCRFIRFCSAQRDAGRLTWKPCNTIVQCIRRITEAQQAQRSTGHRPKQHGGHTFDI